MNRYEMMVQELQEIPEVDGISPTDILELPEPLDLLLRTLMRKGSMTAKEFAIQLDLPEKQAQHLGDLFVDKGYLQIETEEPGTGPVYRVYFARARKRNIPSGLFD